MSDEECTTKMGKSQHFSATFGNIFLLVWQYWCIFLKDKKYEGAAMRMYTREEIKEAVLKARSFGWKLTEIRRATGISKGRLDGLLGPRESMALGDDVSPLCDWLVNEGYLENRPQSDTTFKPSAEMNRESARRIFADELQVLAKKLLSPDFSLEEINSDFKVLAKRFLSKLPTTE